MCCRVPCPSHFDETQSADQCSLDVCKAVGHVDCRGGDYPDKDGKFLNAFGKAFLQAGREWTTGERHGSLYTPTPAQVQVLCCICCMVETALLRQSAALDALC